MTDLSTTIAPNSNQLTADDLINRTLTVTITKVSKGNAEQPIAINFEGDGGKPFFPCKTMRRAMVTIWGADGAQYVGRSMTLYRDPGVKFGGIQVGGIRISHMSHMEKDTVLALQETKGAKKPLRVRVLQQQAAPAQRQQPARQASQQQSEVPKPVPFMDRLHTWLAGCATLAAVDEVEDKPIVQKALSEAPEDVCKEIHRRLTDRRKALEPQQPDDGEMPFDFETGEFTGEAA